MDTEAEANGLSTTMSQIASRLTGRHLAIYVVLIEGIVRVDTSYGKRGKYIKIRP